MSIDPFADWMQINNHYIGHLPLRHICMLGTHDSGMDRNNNNTLFGVDGAVRTQTQSILGQLESGVRYFDIRPVIGGGEYYTGHYGHIADLTWQGGRGESIDEIINDLNTFTASHNELIVFSLSHAYNTDNGNNNYTDFTQEEWYGLFNKLYNVQHLYTNTDVEDLTTLPLSEFINDKPCVLMIVRSPAHNEPIELDLGAYQGVGFFKDVQYPQFDEYAESNDLDHMMYDQAFKMKVQRTSRDSECFLFSWTLTQEGLQAVNNIINIDDTILDMAHRANRAISRVISYCTADSYPNVISIDKAETGYGALEYVMQINKFFAYLKLPDHV